MREQWKRALDSGVGDLTPQDMRSYLVSTLLDQGVDLALVAHIVGHSYPAIRTHDRGQAEQCRDAVAHLQLPPPMWDSLSG